MWFVVSALRELHVNCTPHFGLIPPPPSLGFDALDAATEGSISDVIDASADGG